MKIYWGSGQIIHGVPADVLYNSNSKLCDTSYGPNFARIFCPSEKYYLWLAHGALTNLMR